MTTYYTTITNYHHNLTPNIVVKILSWVAPFSYEVSHEELKAIIELLLAEPKDEGIERYRK